VTCVQVRFCFPTSNFRVNWTIWRGI